MKTIIVLAMHGAPPLDFPKNEMAELMGSHHHDELEEHAHVSHEGHHSHHSQEAHSEHLAPTPTVATVAIPRTQQLRRQRLAKLAAKMRSWPRTAANDPFFAGSHELAASLAAASRCEVVVGFNEFCDPTIPMSLDQAVAMGAARIVVITPMMTRGGEHSETDILSAVQSARAHYPDIEIIYAWPFEVDVVSRFLAAQVQRFLD